MRCDGDLAVLSVVRYGGKQSPADDGLRCSGCLGDHGSCVRVLAVDVVQATLGAVVSLSLRAASGGHVQLESRLVLAGAGVGLARSQLDGVQR